MFANSYALVFLTALAASLTPVASPAAETNPSMTLTTPVFGQIVSYTLPAGFAHGYENVSATGYIQESVPAGETVDDWTQIITMTGAKDAAGADQPLEAAAQNTLARYRDACPKTLSAQSFGPSRIDGRESLTVFLGCGGIKTADGGEISEKSVVSFIKGTTEVYTLQWAEHTPATTTAPDYDQALWTDRLSKLAPIRICDRVAGEGAPYPSCVFRD